MSIDKYLHKTFDAKHYNCWDFAREVWLDLKKEDLCDRVTAPTKPVDLLGVTAAIQRHEHEFKKLDKPVSPCLVFMEKKKQVPHVGIYVRGNILSIDTRGVTFLPCASASMGFTEVGFYL